jgi:hypothetical protein
MAYEFWFQTYTGKMIDVVDPAPSMVSVEDIAHALSMTCRFGGHCRDFYSVGEHSLLVERLGGRSLRPSNEDQSAISAAYLLKTRLAFLLHDAAEAYLGDIVTPIKRGLGSSLMGACLHYGSGKLRTDAGNCASIRLEELERRWLSVIGRRFGLGDLLTDRNKLVDEADAKALSCEVVVLMHPVLASWWTRSERPHSEDLALVKCISPAEARREFLARFYDLTDALRKQNGETGTAWEEKEFS